MGLPWLASKIWGPMLGGLMSGFVRRYLADPAGFMKLKGFNLNDLMVKAAARGIPNYAIMASVGRLSWLTVPSTFEASYNWQFNLSGSARSFSSIPRDIKLDENVLQGLDWAFPEWQSTSIDVSYWHRAEVTYLDEAGQENTHWITLTSRESLTIAEIEDTIWERANEESEWGQYWVSEWGMADITAVNHSMTIHKIGAPW